MTIYDSKLLYDEKSKNDDSILKKLSESENDLKGVLFKFDQLLSGKSDSQEALNSL